jgi:amino acid transporter
MAEEQQQTGLQKNALGVIAIIMLVMATNGPLTVIVGATPAAISLGNGLGLPSVFLIVGLIYLIFSVGFAAMSRHVKNAGAFYAYVSKGLGSSIGIAAAFVAILSYSFLNLALYGLFGQFGSMLVSQITGLTAPWWLVCAVFVMLVHFCATRNITFNGRILGVLLASEIAIALILNLGVAVQGPGPDGWLMDSFQPSTVFVPGFGAAVVLVIVAFMGFETAAIYAEEARNPKRNIPLALFASVVIIALLDGLTTWFMMSAFGRQETLSMASQNPGAIWFEIAARVLGGWAATALELLTITSLFAAILSFQNTLSRYFFVLGREGVISRQFSRLHPTQQTPHIAARLQSALMLIGVLIAGYLDLNPLTQLAAIASAPASIGIVLVQLLTALAVIGFFFKDPKGASVWQRLISPAFSAVALFGILWLMVGNIALLSGGQSVWIDVAIPLIVIAAGAIGLLYAWWLKSNKPTVFSGLTKFVEET